MKLEPRSIEVCGVHHSRRFQNLHARRLTRASGLAIRWVSEPGEYLWVMTSQHVETPAPESVATGSKEEGGPYTLPDSDQPPGVRARDLQGQRATFTNNSGNLERGWSPIGGIAGLLLACEIIEHLVCAPQRLLLNANRWLESRECVLATTPNGERIIFTEEYSPATPVTGSTSDTTTCSASTA